MHLSRLTIHMCAAVAIASISATGALAAGPEPEAFILDYENVRISPDGRHVATLAPSDMQNALLTFNFDNPPGEGGEPVQTVGTIEDIDFNSFVWVNNERVFVQVTSAFVVPNPRSLRNQTSGAPQVAAINIDGTRPSLFRQFDFDTIASFLPNDSDNIVMRDGNHAYNMNIYNGEIEERAPGRTARGHVFTDNGGRVRAMFERGRHNAQEIKLFWRSNNQNNWRSVYDETLPDGYDLFPFPEFGNGDDIYLNTNLDGRFGIYRISPEQGDTLEQVFLDERYDVQQLNRDRRTGAILSAQVQREYWEREYFDEDAEALDQHVNAALPGSRAFVVDSSVDGNRHVVVAGDPGQPDTYYLYDQDAEVFRLFGAAHSGLNDVSLAPVRAVSYTVQDEETEETQNEMEIPAYLTVPEGLGDGPQPLVVLPHDGPFSRDGMDFDRLRQFIASRGYVVFQPNFRGSTGFGVEHHQAGVGEFGGKIQDDISDGVQYLIDQGIADPSRICIVGWSYGAYAALNGAVTTPGLYQCAVGVDGYYDLPQLRSPTSVRYAEEAPGDWEDLFGPRHDDRRRLRRISPRFSADQISIPVLLIASSRNAVAHVEQARDMATAMDSAGVTNERLFYTDENRYAGEGPSMIGTLEAIEDFLGRHLQ